MFLVMGILAIVTAIGTVILGWNGKKRRFCVFPFNQKSHRSK